MSGEIWRLVRCMVTIARIDLSAHNPHFLDATLSTKFGNTTLERLVIESGRGGPEEFWSTLKIAYDT